MLSSIRSLMAAALVLASAAAVAAPKLYVGNFADNTVSVIDTATRAVVATIPVAQGPHGMAITHDGRTLYVTGDGSSQMSIIDTATDKVVKTVEVGKTQNGVSLTAGDKLALVAVYAEDRIAFFDTAAQAVVGSVAVPKPHTISISPDGKLAYVTTQDPGHFALTVVDIAARAVVRSVPLEKTPRDAEFGYDGKAFYFTEAGVSAVQVLDPATDRIVGEIPTGVSPHFVNLFRGAPLGMVVVQGPGQVLLFDPATNKPVRTIGVGKQPHWLALSGDGKTAYVSNEGSADVSLVDIASGSTTSVAVGKSPRKIVVQPSAQPAGSAAKVSGTELAFVTLSKVSIAGFAFQPQAINIKAGESVAWSNDDGPAHTITFKDGSAGTKNLSPGETFTRAFDRPGTYEYFCSFHPYMTGRVVVSAN